MTRLSFFAVGLCCLAAAVLEVVTLTRYGLVAAACLVVLGVCLLALGSELPRRER